MTARIAIVGLPFYGKRVAQSLTGAGYRARYLPRPGRSPRAWAALAAGLLRADLVYAVGSSIAVNAPVDLMARLRRPILMHWVGSDVVAALREHAAGRVSARLLRATHWADAPWLVDELAPVGLRATGHPLPIPTAIGVPIPLPSDFRVLLYLPARPHPAHDEASALEVVRALPGVSFVVVGGFQPPDPLANLDARGYLPDLAPVYRETVALLRLVRHDGMSHSIIEALSFGRHALWSYPFPGVVRVCGAAEAIAAIRDLQLRFDAGTLGLNDAGAGEVTHRYRWDTLLNEVRTGIDALLT